MSQLRSIKLSLGSSLDQGLDKPVQSPALGSQSKRICKSEESAIDNKALVLAKNKSSNSSNETLNSAILNIDNLSFKNKDNFVESSDKVVIESNIEIMIPISISKAVNLADSLESSASARDRSSNSISSCEMALGNGQTDADESINGNHVGRKEELAEIEDDVLPMDETLKNIKDVIDSAWKNGAEHNCKNQVLQNYDTSATTVNEQTSSSSNQKQSPLTETAIYSREHLAKSCLSLDNVCTCEESEQKQDSTRSYPEQCTNDVALRQKRNSESK